MDSNSLTSGDGVLSAHGAASSGIDMLVGLGPVILGAVLIGVFILLLAAGRKPGSPREGWRDETPTSARLLFSGRYFELEELLRHELDAQDRRPTEPEVSTHAAQ